MAILSLLVSFVLHKTLFFNFFVPLRLIILNRYRSPRDSDNCSLNPTAYGLYNKLNLVIWLSEDVFNISFNMGFVFDVMGRNPIAQPSTLRIVALRNF